MDTPNSFSIECPACQVTHQTQAEKLDIPAKCNKCGVDLPTAIADKPITGRRKTFETMVFESSLPVLVDFWADWCPPCKVLGPTLETLAKQYAGKLRVVKINSDENRSLSDDFDISSIPTLILFDKGQIKNQHVGAMPLGQLKNWINRTLGWQ